MCLLFIDFYKKRKHLYWKMCLFMITYKLGIYIKKNDVLLEQKMI